MPMARSCHDGQYWDSLVRKCLDCHVACRQPHVITRCTNYCDSANCKALPGHYYDGLLKKCVRCAEVCGRHTAECSQHCQKQNAQSTPAPPPPVITKKLLVGITSDIPNSRAVPTALEDSTILFSSLLALCMVLLFSSLSLALVVFLRGTKTKTSNPGHKEANHCQECVVQPGQEVGSPRGQPGQSSKDSSRPRDCEPSEDSSPTETCVCVHCFPDLKALGHSNDRPPRASFPFYPQAVLQRAQIQKGGPLRTGENHLQTSGLEVQENSALG